MTVTQLKAYFFKALETTYPKTELQSLFTIATTYYLKLTRIDVQLNPNAVISKADYSLFTHLISKLKQQQPIQYILQEADFFDLKFKVTPSVLIPRQETEELVDWIINQVKQQYQQQSISILDIGTGSGCVAISLAKHLPNAKVYALDISAEALQIAKHNAKQQQVDVTFLHADILSSTAWKTHFKNTYFDIIVSNPPYVRELEKQDILPNVLDYEPHLALFVSNTNPLAFYSTITQFALHYLKPKGYLYFEINQYLGVETQQLLIDSAFTSVELRKDLNGNPRMLMGQHKTKK